MMNGGDDYVTKPFSLDVLTAKVTAILRRTYGEYVTAVTNDLSCGDCKAGGCDFTADKVPVFRSADHYTVRMILCSYHTHEQPASTQDPP